MGYKRVVWVIVFVLVGVFGVQTRASAGPKAVPGVLMELLGARDAGVVPYSPREDWIEESVSVAPRQLSLHRINIDRIEVTVGSALYQSRAHEMQRISIDTFRHGAPTMRVRLGPVVLPASTRAGQPIEAAAIDFAGGRHLLFSGEVGAIHVTPVGRLVSLTVDAFARRLQNFGPRSRVYQNLSRRDAMEVTVQGLDLPLRINADWQSEVQPILRQKQESDLFFALHLANTEAMQVGPVAEDLVVTASTFTPPAETRTTLEWTEMTVDEIGQVIASNQGRQPVILKLDQHRTFNVRQNDETDFAFLDRLARKDGWRFYLTQGKLHLEDRESYPRPPVARNGRFGLVRPSDVMKKLASRCGIALQVGPSARSLSINQSRETDAAFLLRLAAEEGLGLRAGNPGSLVAFPARSFSRGEQWLRRVDLFFGTASYSHEFASHCEQIADPMGTPAELVELSVAGQRLPRSRGTSPLIQARTPATLATSPSVTAEVTTRVDFLLKEIGAILATQPNSSTRRARLLLSFSRELQAGIVARFAQASDAYARLDRALASVRSR